MIFRAMEKEDLDSVAMLEAEAFSMPWSRKAFEEALENEFYKLFVAYDNGVHVGTVCFIQSFDEADVTNVAIMPSYRHKGIGYELLNFGMEKMKDYGVNSFALEVRSLNSSAIGLYEKLGFVNEGVRKNFYSNPTDNAIIMWKR